MGSRFPAELQSLRRFFQQYDPAPEHTVAAAYAALGRRFGAGATALELVADSAADQSRVRSTSGPQPRVLTFAMPGRVLELGLVPGRSGTFHASGMVLNRAGHTPPDGEVVIRHPRGSCRGDLDEYGVFEVDGVPRGPISVVLQSRCSAPAVTDWLVC